MSGKICCTTYVGGSKKKSYHRSQSGFSQFSHKLGGITKTPLHWWEEPECNICFHYKYVCIFLKIYSLR